jgi:hypothetical protein
MVEVILLKRTIILSFLILFLLSTSVASPVIDRILANLEKNGITITYDYPWRTGMFNDSFSHILQIDTSAETFSIITDIPLSLELDFFERYGKDLSHIFGISGWRDAMMVFVPGSIVYGRQKQLSGYIFINNSFWSFKLNALDEHRTLLVINVRDSQPQPVTSASGSITPLEASDPGDLPDYGINLIEENSNLRLQLVQLEALKLSYSEKERLNEELKSLLSGESRLNEELWERLNEMVVTISSLQELLETYERESEKEKVRNEDFERFGEEMNGIIFDMQSGYQRLENDYGKNLGELSERSFLLSFRDEQVSRMESVIIELSTKVASLTAQNTALTAEVLMLRAKIQATTIDDTVEKNSFGTNETKPLPKLVREVFIPQTQQTAEQPYYLEYVYDEHDRVKTILKKGIEDTVVERREYVYGIQDRLESIRVWDEKSALLTEKYVYQRDGTLKIEVYENAFLQGYQYLEKNDSGQLARITFYDGKNEKRFYQDFFYKEGRIERIDTYSPSGTRISQMNHVYNDQNYLETVQIMEQGIVRQIRHYEYDTDWFLQKMSIYDDTLNCIAYTEYYYQ